jgi:peptide/nickel transport system substrate-binding protein
MQTIAMDELPWIPIVDPAVRLFLNDRVTGVPASFVYLYYPWAADLGAATS